MRIIKAIGALAALFVACAPLWAAQPKRADITFRIDPAAALPGLPVAFLVTLPEGIVETSEDPVPARLHVTSEETGESFAAHFGGEPAGEGRLDLWLWAKRPQGFIEVQQPLTPPYGPGWFADERLQKPGTYRLRLQVLASERGLPRDLWSSQATLVVREPEGVDAEAWAWLQTLSPELGWKWKARGRPELAQQLVEKFPASEYARYAIGSLDGHRGDFETWLDKAVELSKGTWLEEYYLLRLYGYRANGGSPCMAQAFAGTPADRLACMMREAAEASTKFEAMGARSSSLITLHTVEVARQRFKDQIESLRAARAK